MDLLAMSRTSLERVAEYNRVWRVVGVSEIMVSMSSMNPMSSILSASSMTSSLTASNTRTPRPWRSRILPGVPTTTSHPSSSLCTCSDMLAPPYTATILCFVCDDMARISLETWSASSLVGAMTTVVGVCEPARVLPRVIIA